MSNSTFKILIVDDEELARKMLLTATDWNALHMEIIAEAVSGQDALSIMEEQLPDILLTDIKMPYMDGMELCRIVTRQYPHIKIVITTAFKDFEYAQQCISLGVSHFLLKPINRGDLVSILLKLREQIEKEKQQWLEFDHLKKILEKIMFSCGNVSYWNFVRTAPALPPRKSRLLTTSQTESPPTSKSLFWKPTLPTPVTSPRRNTFCRI